MLQSVIVEKLEKLPEPLQTEVLHYIEFLLDKYVPDMSVQVEPKKRKAGLLKGKIWMADDFDAPLEDLKDYM
ncbi:DUF2281 domain-containing protein [Thermoleptolyngbya sp. C42_A2020_037]|uniref:type II toxin-antitoxin system VapB family antitoxin n=1 Tax=Thermoleptolyngbya sp. C42_A2020_037 TaxID=2747799 RepID=UPI0019FF6532|nr:DUF2281 domain-containing protein [Thermoleptolyngbya sp. C42_A2020_037]MBF2085224.1 DUF2281 domain-containing protein [Thermoleptolyngbya sp. C42_A2020_037]